jgi:cytoskeletal protein CcmA (bactofilin family)
MYIDPLHLWVLLVATASGFTVFSFLPSMLEVLRPKDKGPRKILKKPLHERIRKSSASKSVPDLKDDVELSKDLKAALRDAGLRSQRIGKDTVRILGSITFKPHLEILESIVVDGNMSTGDRCIFHGSLKSYGDMSVGSFDIVEGNMLSERDIKIGDDAVIAGSVHSKGSVRIGERVYVGSTVVAEGNVELFENSEVRNILTRGSTRVRPSLQLDLPSSIYRID